MTATITSAFGFATPYLIDNGGEMIGIMLDQQSDKIAVQYRFGGTATVQYPAIDLLGQILFSGINALGEASGTTIGPLGETVAATIWQNGTATALPTWTGDNLGNALGLNDFGVVVGVSLTRTGAATFGAEHALVWQNGKATLLSPLAGDIGADADAINDAGLIAGVSYGPAVAGGTSNFDHAVTWTGGVASRLAAVSGAVATDAFFIDAGGDVAGTASFADGTSHAALWHKGSATDLGSLSGFGWSRPTAMNDLGQVVGTVSTVADYDGTEGSQHAVLWQGGKIIDLNSLFPTSSSAGVLTYVSSINDAGEIIAGTADGSTVLIDLNGPFPGQVSPAASVIQAVTQGVSIGPVSFADSAADLVANLDGLQGMAAQGQLGTIFLTDGGIPNLTVTAAQFSANGAVLGQIAGNHTVIVQIAGTAAQHSFAGEDLTGADAVQFSDQTVIVAAAPGHGAVTTGNITELYAAVLDREPDVAGLAFYQNYLEANPGTSFLQFAEWFLSSPEYTGNPAHTYAQTMAGDAQFITDSYQNLLHRAPSAADIDYYQTNVMAKALAGLTAGTAAYSNAEFQARAQMLVYFSASPEFLSDVQITASNPASAQHWLVLV